MNELTLPLAKVTRPRIHGPILRKRLFKLLDERKRHSVIWVSGSPDFGASAAPERCA